MPTINIDIIKFILMLVLLLLPESSIAQTKFKNTITGRVTDAETGEPLFDVNVFLANTTLGAATNRDGDYLIKNIPPGNYDLVFSMMGYELQTKIVQLSPSVTLRNDMKLRPRVLKGKEVQIVASIPEEWKKHLKRFTTEFLGQTENARKCKIINPEVVNFEVDEENKKFIATAESILVVENQSLGYRLHIILDTFRISKDSLIYATYPLFEELTPHNDKEQENWNKNRIKNYKGSFRHFLSALARGILEQEKFILFKMSNERVDPKTLNLIPGSSPELKWFYLAEPLEVVYLGLFISGEGKHLPEFLGKFPSSIMYLPTGSALIDTLGNVLTKFSIIYSGFWYHERFANLLPHNYTLEK